MKTNGSVMLMIALLGLAAAVGAVADDNVQLSNVERVGACSGTQRYRLTMKYNWTNATHPGTFPTNATKPGFSPLVAISHSMFYTLWAPMDRASRGVERVAETGDPSLVLKELKREMRRDVRCIESKARRTPDGKHTVRVTLQLDSGRSIVSAIAMLIPSPDWFTGVDNVDLCNQNKGTWRKRRAGQLSVFDAGTDRGKDFESEDVPNKNIQPIKEILGAKFGGIPVGRYKIERL